MNGVWGHICDSYVAARKTAFQLADFPGYAHDQAMTDVYELHQAGWVVFDSTHATLTTAGIKAIAARLAEEEEAAKPKQQYLCQWCKTKFGQDKAGYDQHKPNCPDKPARTMGDN